MGKFILPTSGGGGSISSGWLPSEGWIDITDAGTNEINLLVTRGGALAFQVKVGNNTGTFDVDWGDGNTSMGLSGDITITHDYVYNTGGTLCEKGYYVYKVRIYNASENITQWRVARSSLSLGIQYSPILWAVFNCPGITNLDYAFYNTTGNKVFSNILEAVEIKTLQSCTSITYFAQNCNSLKYIKLPDTWGNVTTILGMFYSCLSLREVKLPVSWGNVSIISTLFYGCYSLASVVLPLDWSGISSMVGAFQNCYSLGEITLPASYSNTTTCNDIFKNCTSLRTINNIQYIGKPANTSRLTSTFSGCEVLQTPIHVTAKLARFTCSGTASIPNKCTEIRFFNPDNTFEDNTVPTVDISYNSLEALELNTLFGDLPVVTGKTIYVTGNPGAATCNTTIASSKGWTVTT